MTVNLAAGLTVYLIWRVLLSAPTRDLLPDAWRCRVRPVIRPQPGLRALAAVSLAVMLGTATHVFWDAFTHRDRWGVDALPRIFYAPITLPGDRAVPLYKLLQHGSSVIGLPLLAAWAALSLWRRPPVDPHSAPTAPIALRRTTVICLALLPVVASASALMNHDANLAWRLHHAATRSGATIATTLLMYAMAWHLLLRERV